MCHLYPHPSKCQKCTPKGCIFNVSMARHKECVQMDMFFMSSSSPPLNTNHTSIWMCFWCSAVTSTIPSTKNAPKMVHFLCTASFYHRNVPKMVHFSVQPSSTIKMYHFRHISVPTFFPTHSPTKMCHFQCVFVIF